MEFAALILSVIAIGFAVLAYKKVYQTLDPFLGIAMVYVGGMGLAVLACLIKHWIN